MGDFYRFIVSYEMLIYIVLAIGGLFALRWLWSSWGEWRMAVYQLEREFSGRRLGQAMAVSAIILMLFCVEFFMATFIIPGLPADVFVSTPTLDFLATPTGTLSPDMMTQYAAGPAPAAVPEDSPGCIPDKVILTSPVAGHEVQGTVDLEGTVDIPDFGFYKYEVAQKGSDTWATISADRKVVRNGVLGHWDTSSLTPGDYQLRLVVTDNKGQALPPCIVPVRVTAP